MPNDYHCLDCHLSFSVGWFHYHEFPEYDGVRYGSETLLVCRECGTQHRLEQALTETRHDRLLARSGPKICLNDMRYVEEHRKERKAQQRRNRYASTWYGPIYQALLVIATVAAFAMWILYMCTVKQLANGINNVYVWSRKRLGYVPEQPTLYKVVAAAVPRLPEGTVWSDGRERTGYSIRPDDAFLHLFCSHCHAAGTLESHQNDAVCPHCKQPALECYGSWIT